MPHEGLEQEALEHGIGFFGRIMASLSHEITNVLSIVGEVAGLLDDMSNLAERGRPVDPAKLQRQCERISSQLRRGQLLVASMNRFAHSADGPVQRIDLNDFVQQAADLFHRFGDLHRTRFEVQPADQPVIVETSVFFLFHLVFLVLDVFLSEATDDQRIHLSVLADGGQGALRLGRSPAVEMDTKRQELLCRLAQRSGISVTLQPLPHNVAVCLLHLPRQGAD